MTDHLPAGNAGEPQPEAAPARRSRGVMIALTVLLGGVLVVLLLVAGMVRGVSSLARAVFHSDRTAISQSVVVERTRAVARLVTAETTVRDVVTYEDRHLGSTKRALVVVTGRVLTGIDLERAPKVEIDHSARRIHLELPPAQVLGVEITNLRTYDERQGLWNPFRPADRDTIFMLARAQLRHAAREFGVTERAQETARTLLQGMLSTDGYQADVSFAGEAARDLSPRVIPPEE